MGCNCGGGSRVAYEVTLPDGTKAPGSPFASSLQANKVARAAGRGAKMKPVPKPPDILRSAARR